MVNPAKQKLQTKVVGMKNPSTLTAPSKLMKRSKAGRKHAQERRISPVYKRLHRRLKTSFKAYLLKKTVLPLITDYYNSADGVYGSY